MTSSSKVLHVLKNFRPVFTGVGVFLEHLAPVLDAQAPHVEHHLLAPGVDEPFAVGRPGGRAAGFGARVAGGDGFKGDGFFFGEEREGGEGDEGGQRAEQHGVIVRQRTGGRGGVNPKAYTAVLPVWKTGWKRGLVSTA